MTGTGSSESRGTTSLDESAGIPEDAFFRAIVENTSEGLFAVDESCTVVFANPAMEDVLGYAPSELVGASLSSVVPGRFARYRTILDLVSRGDETGLGSGRVDLPAVHADGHDTWVSCSFRVLARADPWLVVGAVRDVSDRREREEDLVRHERVVETIDDGIYVLDADFSITDVNEAVVSMTGYSRDELIGSHVSLLTTEDTIAKAAEMSAALTESRAEAATLVTEIATKDGDRIPIETRFSLYPFDDDSYGQVGVVRDVTERKQFEDTLTALHDSTRELLAVDSKEDVCALIVDTATDVVDLSAAVVYLFDPEENVLAPCSPSSREVPADGVTDSRGTLPAGEGHPWRVFVENETAIVDASTDPGSGPNRSGDGAMYVPLGDHGVFVVSAEPDAFDDDTRTLVELLAASAEAGLSSLERAVGIRERDRELARQNRRLRRLDQVNGIIREIDQALVEADSADEIGSAVCDRLVTSDRFAFAWIGELDAATGTLRPRARSGHGDGYLDDVVLESADPDEPAARAMADRTMQVVGDVGSSLGGERWRRAAIARDFRSVVGVPLLHDDLSYGVLTVYADRPDAFEGMENVLGELGETIANAVDAVATKQALFSDSRVELGFRLATAETVLQRIARLAESRVEYEGLVLTDDGTSRVFATVHDARPAEVRALADRIVTVESVRLVAERGDSVLVEVVTDAPVVATAFVEHGAAVRSMTADGEEVRLHVDVPNDADVREFVDLVRARYPGAELVSRHDGERPRRTPTEFRFEFEDRLTGRQLEVLRVAYLSGFFEWPRETTGQQIADSLDVSQPTVNRHLRTCERKLFGLLFDRP